MTKAPHAKMKRINKTRRIPMVRGFGPLNSKLSNDLSGIIHLHKDSIENLISNFLFRPSPIE
jgi:hypothetical protein